MKYKILALFFLATSATVFAGNIDLNKELAPTVKQTDPAEVRSYQSEYGATITEYKSNGKVWMIKVQPSGDFPPYYLYDDEGDGEFERRVAGNKRPSPPMWIIKQF